MKKKITLLISIITVILISCVFQSSAMSDSRPYDESAKNIKIIDHVVYKLAENGKYYSVYDWFDTDEAVNLVAEIKIAEEIDGVPVTEISTFFSKEYNYSGYLFIGEDEADKNTTVKEIIIPSSIKTIYGGAFTVFDAVEEITIPETVTFLGEAFVRMDSLKKVIVNCDVKNLGGFNNCPELKEIVFNSDVKSISEYAFLNCLELKSINLPDSLESVSSYAFKGSSVEIVSMPSCYVTEEAFYDCKTLKKVTFRVDDSKSTISIGEAAFMKCENLKKIVVTGVSPEKIRVYKDAFLNCDKLTDIYYCAGENKWDEVNVVDSGNPSYSEATVHFYHKHTHNFTLTVKKATCKKTGTKTYSCICGDAEKVIIPKVSHNYGDWKTTKKATTKADGTMARTCKVCGKSQSRAIVYGNKPGKTSKINVSVKDKTLTLKWAEVKGATGYRVYRYNESTGKYKKVKDVEVTTLSFKNVTTSYKYAVKAYCEVDGKVYFSSKYTTVKG